MYGGNYAASNILSLLHFYQRKYVIKIKCALFNLSKKGVLMNKIYKILSAVALLSALTLSGCYVQKESSDDKLPIEEDEVFDGGGVDGDQVIIDTVDGNVTDNTVTNSNVTDNTVTDSDISDGKNEESGEKVDDKVEGTTAVTPVKTVITYIKITADGVNIRTGAGTNYAISGTAEKNTLYAVMGKSGEWYKTYYKNSTVYINAKYCVVVEMESASKEVESVIAEGMRYMGVKYVYGATRYHDGNGNLIKGFTTSAFDCSSLMQYIFYKGAGVKLQTTTRTQVKQGTFVAKSNLKRGDLIFFTNEARKNNSGIERVGHVALYLGDNYILHTSSDYAKIEQISAARWAFYIQSQRML
jgi:cell wall-associated NlpC family hydrolase